MDLRNETVNCEIVTESWLRRIHPDVKLKSSALERINYPNELKNAVVSVDK